MATALHFCGGKVAYPVFTKGLLHCQALLTQRIDFANNVAPNSGLCASVKFSRKSRVLRVSCEVRRSDVLERNKTEYLSDGEAEAESEKQLTCVMKFGGSSLASAERMREVADLILSFPDERPIIVLSAMGKTTNKLLLVHFFFSSSFCLATRTFSG